MRKGVSEVRLHTYGEIEKEKEIDSGERLLTGLTN